MSVPWTSSMPPAMAWPLSAEMIGFSGSKLRSRARLVMPGSAATFSSHSFSGLRVPETMGMSWPRSAPAQKAAPVPVTTQTRTLSSSLMLRQASSRRTATSGLMALRASGRFSVTTATWPRTS